MWIELGVTLWIIIGLVLSWLGRDHFEIGPLAFFMYWCFLSPILFGAMALCIALIWKGYLI